MSPAEWWAIYDAKLEEGDIRKGGLTLAEKEELYKLIS
jgi:hypothetical protein